MAGDSITKVDPGACPICGSHNLDYVGDFKECDLLGYKFYCEDCGSSGVEWYEVSYLKSTAHVKE